MTGIGFALARAELIRTLTAYNGITTADGAIDGTTLFDINLKDNPSISASAIPEKTILIMSGPAAQEDKGAASFVNATGEITLQGTGFSHQITKGTIFRILNISSVEIDVKNLSDKLGAFTATENLKAIIGGYTAASPLKAAIDALSTLANLLDLTTFKQETAPATDVNGTTWKDLLDKSTITKPTKLCGFKVTVAGTWAGKAQVRITDGAGTKIFPFQDQYEQDTEFTSGTQVAFNFPVVVPIADGYKFQFRSSNAGDGAGETLELDNLDVIEVG